MKGETMADLKQFLLDWIGAMREDPAVAARFLKSLSDSIRYQNSMGSEVPEFLRGIAARCARLENELIDANEKALEDFGSGKMMSQSRADESERRYLEILESDPAAAEELGE